jgi:cytochrome c oxidase subunit IV
MHEESTHHPTHRVYYTVFGALLALLVVTAVVAEMKLGLLAFLVAVTVATVKAVLILLYFMHVRYSPPLTWLVAGAAFFWLAILFTLTLSDYYTREPSSTRPIGQRTGQPSSLPIIDHFDANAQRPRR